MGNVRPRPKRLASKLLQIRNELGLTQAEIVRRLGAEAQIEDTTISKYELDKREPPLEILLKYARAAGIHLEDLVDDELDLPPKLPGNVKYQGLKRSSKSRRSR